MHLDPILTLCAVLLAMLGWVAYQANVWLRRDREQMSPEQRREEEARDGDWGG